MSETIEPKTEKTIVGADRLSIYLPLIKGKTIGVVGNQTSRVGNDHLVDVLIDRGIKIQTIFSPEHGFRGNADAGERVNNSVDEKTGIPIISLHGKTKKLPPDYLNGIDYLLFDIQDVGVRFYTYLSTLHYVMEACAKSKTKLIVLDRPNPNARYIDGPMMEKEFMSFLGLHPVPVVYGMTIGEYAQMINGEGWLNGKQMCDLTVVPLVNWDHNKNYSLPIKPSPNLQNDQTIQLYPSLCFFEQTPISVGRGTKFPFQVFGSPQLREKFDFSFKPVPNIVAKRPKFNGQVCYGIDLRKEKQTNQLNLSWLILAYSKANNKNQFFYKNFALLAGTKTLEWQIQEGYSEDQIRESWQENLDAFKKIRNKYLIYTPSSMKPEF